jgi:hypothetical protein
MLLLRLIKCSIISLSRCVIFVHNSRFSEYLHLIYPNELEVKVTTDTQKSASYLEIDNGGILKKNSMTNAMTSLFQ